MTESEWMDSVKENRKVLTSIIDEYHPTNGMHLKHKSKITAIAAEAACMDVRAQIYNRRSTTPILDQFNEAIEKNDWRKINNILNETWFGVPESLGCWNITGFQEMVELLEDPPNAEDLDDSSVAQ